MRTTIDIPDSIYRQIKARAALQGQTVKAFFLDALKDKLTAERSRKRSPSGWRAVFGKADKVDTVRVQRMIDQEFAQIDLEDWK